MDMKAVDNILSIVVRLEDGIDPYNPYVMLLHRSITDWLGPEVWDFYRSSDGNEERNRIAVGLTMLDDYVRYSLDRYLTWVGGPFIGSVKPSVNEAMTEKGRQKIAGAVRSLIASDPDGVVPKWARPPIDL